MLFLFRYSVLLFQISKFKNTFPYTSSYIDLVLILLNSLETDEVGDLELSFWWKWLKYMISWYWLE